jgi:hypothetical protein
LGSGLSVGGSIEVAVRVRLRVRGRNDKYVELVVLASGGAEVEEGLVEPLITDVTTGQASSFRAGYACIFKLSR